MKKPDIQSASLSLKYGDAEALLAAARRQDKSIKGRAALLDFIANAYGRHGWHAVESAPGGIFRPLRMTFEREDDGRPLPVDWKAVLGVRKTLIGFAFGPEPITRQGHRVLPSRDGALREW